MNKNSNEAVSISEYALEYTKHTMVGHLIPNEIVARNMHPRSHSECKQSFGKLLTMDSKGSGVWAVPH